MGINDDQLWDLIKIVVGAGISGIIIIITGLWRGWFSKLKEGYQKEVTQVKAEAAFEQVDKVTNILLTNAINGIENLGKRQDEILEKVSVISEQMVADRKDIEHLKEGLKELKERNSRARR